MKVTTLPHNSLIVVSNLQCENEHYYSVKSNGQLLCNENCLLITFSSIVSILKNLNVFFF